MPAFEKRDLKQKAVLWVYSGRNDYGEPIVKSPVEINVRWEKGMKESVDAEGETIGISDIAIVDRYIPIGSIMWLGALSDLPDSPTDLRYVADYKEVPDIKGRNVRRQVALRRYSDQLPTVSS